MVHGGFPVTVSTQWVSDVRNAGILEKEVARFEGSHEAMRPMTLNDVETELLIDHAAAGDVKARESLQARHRARLRRMVAVRLDDRVAAQVDASDVVQDTLLDASLKLDAYLRERPLPYYPWLHRLATEQIAHVHCRHLQTQARGVGREVETRAILSNATSRHLIDHLSASRTCPSQHTNRKQESGPVGRGAGAPISDSNRTSSDI